MKLEELKKLVEAATPGPWTWRLVDGICNKYLDEGAIVIEGDACSNIDPANCRLIAASRTMLPKLIAVVEALKAERMAVDRAEKGHTAGFDVADAMEATDNALSALEAD